MKRAWILAVFVAFTLTTHRGVTPEARAESGSPTTGGSGSLRAELRRILHEADLGSATVGALFIDVETGEVLFAHHADDQLNPASNAKIVTAAAALALLGSDFRYETALLGTLDGTAVDGNLYLRGRGDPTLRTEDILALAVELRRRGVRVVRGDLVVDATYFDEEFEPPAYDQQPNERSYFRAVVGGVNVNRNVASIYIRPAAAVGRPALVTAVPSGYLDLVNDTVTVEAEAAQSLRLSSRPHDGGTRARVWGGIPLESRRRRLRTRIDNPTRFAGAALADALSSVGIRVTGRVRAGATTPGARMLAVHRSQTLAVILRLLGKISDNFTAETVLKTLGGGGPRPATWERGRQAVRRYLESIGIAPDSYTLVNGSGLFDANRYSPRQLVTLLRALWGDSEIRPEFISQLAIGGVDGTIEGRFRRPPARGHVRAKTGTLATVTALSGYVLAPPGRHTVAFSILINRAGGRLGAGRRLQEQLVTAVAEHLYRGIESQ